MPRAPRDYKLDSPEARSKLAARAEPYWRAIVPGTFVGYRKMKAARAWIARQRQGAGYVEQRIGTPDDQAKADGDVVLTYGQAVKRAQETQIERRAPAPRHYGQGLTLNAVVDAYLEARQTSAGGRTGRPMTEAGLYVSRKAWGRYGRAAIGHKLVTALDADTLRSWHAGIAGTAPSNRGKAQPFDKRDPAQIRARRATANRNLTIAKAALTWARNSDRLPDTMPDWWKRVAPFQLGDDPPPRMLETTEVTRLLNACEPDFRKIVTGALMTGARYGELCALRVRDFDSEFGTVTLHQTKTGKTLRQALTPEGLRFFESESAGRAADAPIFARADGRPWDPSSQTRPMREAAERAKLEDVSFKTTRATYGKLLLLATRDLELVAKALGHSDSRITRRHYAQLLPNEVAAGIAKMPSLGIDNDNKISRIAGKKRGAAVR